MALGNFNNVLKDCQQLLKLAPKNDTAFVLQGMAKFNLNKKQEGIQDLTTVIRLNSKNIVAYM